MFKLSKDERTLITNLLLEYFDLTNVSRRKLFLDSIYDETLPNLENEIDEFNANGNIFCHSLLTKLEKLGNIDKIKQHALHPLLEDLSKLVVGHKSHLVAVEGILKKVIEWEVDQDTPRPLPSEDNEKNPIRTNIHSESAKSAAHLDLENPISQPVSTKDVPPDPNDKEWNNRQKIGLGLAVFVLLVGGFVIQYIPPANYDRVLTFLILGAVFGLGVGLVDGSKGLVKVGLDSIATALGTKFQFTDTFVQVSGIFVFASLSGLGAVTASMVVSAIINDPSPPVTVTPVTIAIPTTNVADVFPAETLTPPSPIEPTNTSSVTITSTIRPIEIVAGDLHTCALMSNQTVWCWGFNSEGQLGVSTSIIASTMPFEVKAEGFQGVTALAARSDNVCALLETEEVWCWGRNNSGQLGRGQDPNAEPNFKPAPVKMNTGEPLTKVIGISTGSYHSCAIRDDDTDTVWCWGANDYGELGIENTLKISSTAVQVPTLDQVNEISAGGHHTCALKNDGTVWCWGYNKLGQLGVGKFPSQSHTPMANSNIKSISEISTGANHTCVLNRFGDIECWGWNEGGAVGLGLSDPIYAPTSIEMGSGTAVSVSIGGFQSCVLFIGNKLFCWGRMCLQKDNSLCVDNSTIQSITDVKIIAAGGYHTCALKNDDTIVCWGDNRYGQFGIYTDANPNFFVEPHQLGQLTLPPSTP